MDNTRDRTSGSCASGGSAMSELDALAQARDDYHTMDELYEYRMLYNALAANAMPGRAVKSWRHSDGEPCFGGGWFVVYLDLPTGQVSNHYKAEHWGLFHIPEVPQAPDWDGHNPAEAADRLRRAIVQRDKTIEQLLESKDAAVRASLAAMFQSNPTNKTEK